MQFIQADPSLENYWRGIILFGRNVASYKFALAHALYDVPRSGSDLILLDDLALHFSRHLCRHLVDAPKQITSQNSQFIDACKRFNAGEIDLAALTEITVRRGFNNVINAFHTVNQAPIDKRFFLDERKTSKGIRLTDNFYQLTERQQYRNLRQETDARWNLVEQGWAMGVSRSLIAVEYDQDSQLLFSRQNQRRIPVTSCRDSLNGYQKGHCFYCYAPIGVVSGEDTLADVDHFIPWKAQGAVTNLNGVWNLVLACQRCNRGELGKFARLPSAKLLQRLHNRNEYFINSHLPLRETLIRQTGTTPAARSSFLAQSWNTAKNNVIFHQWEPPAAGPERF